MLELLIELTEELGARYDLAAVNFFLSWAGALAGIVLMGLVSRRRSITTAAGRIAWAKTCVAFWTTIMLALGGSYPVHLNAQPWLPSVLLAGTVLAILIVNVIAEAAQLRGGPRHHLKNARASTNPAPSKMTALASSHSHSGMAALQRNGKGDFKHGA